MRLVSLVGAIWTTPPGVSTSQQLDYPIPDTAKGTVEGFERFDGTRNKTKVDPDICVFLGDCPASSQLIDVMKDIGVGPCTHCSFKYRGCCQT